MISFTSDELNNILKNIFKMYGVPGMKWGRRKGDLSKVPTKQLRAKVNRMRLERDYKKLIKEEQPSIQKGAKAVGKFMLGLGTATVSSYAIKKGVRLLETTIK